MNNYKTIIIIVDYFFISFIFIPIFLGILYRKKLSKADFYILDLVISLIIVEIVSEILRYNNIRNHFLSYFQTIFILIFSYLFFKEISENSVTRRWLLNWVLLIAILLPIEMIYLSGFNQFNSLTKSLCFIFVAFFSVFFLKKKFQHTSKKLRQTFFFTMLDW